LKKINQKGLGMWVMSKLVLMIFVLSLVSVLSMFVSIYSEKVISDTARSQTILISEIASGSALYASSLDSVFLESEVRVQEANRDYTLLIDKVEEDDNWRTVFLLAWNDQETLEDITERLGFASASATNLSPDINEVLLFEGNAEDAGFEQKDKILVHPSRLVDRDSNLIFFRNITVFCVASVKAQGSEAIKLKEAIERLGACCFEGNREAICA